jgi:hypothetical protein
MQAVSTPRASEMPDERIDSARHAVFLTFFASFLWFSHRLAPGLAFAPWQGAFLAPEGVFTEPFIAGTLFRFTAEIVPDRPLAAMNLLSAVFASGCCAVFAAVIHRGAGNWGPAWRRSALAVAGGLVLGLTPLLDYEATAASPEPVTFFLALMSIWLVMRSYGNKKRLFWLAGAGLAAGLATANNPSMGLLIVAVLVGQGFEALTGRQWAGAVFAVCIPFAAAAALPVTWALVQGGTTAAFLEHGLRSPYPAPGEGFPRLGFGAQTADQVSVAGMLLAGLGMAGLILGSSQQRRLIAWAIMLFIIFGPAYPFLVNQYGAPVDGWPTQAADLLAVSGVLILALTGIWIIGFHGASIATTRWIRMAAAGCAVGLVSVSLLDRDIDRRYTGAEALAAHLLEGSPADSVLIAGDQTVASLLFGAQAGLGRRPDVVVVPGNALSIETRRAALQATHRDALHLPPTFPAYDAYERWRIERPEALKDFLDQLDARLGRRQRLEALALWDFVLDNHRNRSILFAAADAPWLVARGRSRGLMLQYPRHRDAGLVPEAEAVYAGLRSYAEFEGDPEGRRVVSALLVPLSAAQRLQGNEARGMTLANMASSLAPSSLPAALAELRATARSGDAEATQQAAARLQRQRFSHAPPSQWIDVIKADLEVSKVAEQLEALLAGTWPADRPGAARQAFTQRLWEAGEIMAVADAYETILESSPKDDETLFNYAAAMAQLGYVQEARAALQDWIRLTGLSEERVYGMLLRDGRFALLQTGSGGYGAQATNEIRLEGFPRAMRSPRP